MTGRARLVVVVLGGALVGLGAALLIRWPHLAGWPALVVGALIIASVLFEGRYRAGGHVRTMGPGWTPTGEIFHDDESGRWLRVWEHRRNGARRYLPCETPPAN